jgi:RNA polymerase sigma-70 factor (ECF subfamily)
LHDDRLSELTPSWPAPARGETPFDAAARSETERRLERALARLELRDREVILLVAAEGLTPSEAASVLGLTAEALRKRLQRARERLALELDAETAHPQVKVG